LPPFSPFLALSFFFLSLSHSQSVNGKSITFQTKQQLAAAAAAVAVEEVRARATLQTRILQHCSSWHEAGRKLRVEEKK